MAFHRLACLQISRQAERVSWVLRMGLLVILSSCAFVRGEIGKPFPEDLIAEIEKGTSTRQDVTDRLGAPDEIVEANGYEIFHYRRFDSKFGWLLFFSSANVASDNLWVFLNKQHIVEEVLLGNRTDELSFQVWPFGD